MPYLYMQVFNISGERYVTFDGIARACAKAMGAPEPEIIHFNAKDYDFGKKKVRATKELQQTLQCTLCLYRLAGSLSQHMLQLTHRLSAPICTSLCAHAFLSC